MKKRALALFLCLMMALSVLTVSASADNAVPAHKDTLVIGTAAIVSVTANSSQLILTFVMGIILTHLWPKFGREKLNKHIVRAHLIATVLAVIGIVILQ